MSSSGSSNRWRGRLAGVIVLLAGMMAGCASTGAVPRPFPEPRAAAGESATVTGRLLAEAALAFQGTPYRTAGADPSGFDCSGLVQYVFLQHGVAMPRTVAEQFQTGRPIDDDGIEPGDLVFFRIGARNVSY